MATKYDLDAWVKEALEHLGGRATIPQICEYIWRKYEKELRDSGDLFYTWQYDMRWAGQRLSKQKIMKPKRQSPRGMWELS